MNLALHGLSGDIRLGNSYYDDLHKSVGRFDFVMANPPFNVNGVDKDKLAGDQRFPFGLPKPDNGNYLWIQLFYSALNDTGRAGFVMANSAGDAGHSEKEIRRQLIESGAVDVMVAIGTNFFYTVTLPVTLWFLDKGKAGTDREDTVLFIDARHLFRQIDRAHRDFLPEQIEFLANIVRLYRGEDVETIDGSDALLKEHFPDGTYVDVPGLCKVATRAEIEAQGWSLNPGRYTGTAAVDEDDEDFTEKLAGLYEEFTRLSDEADVLRAKVDAAVLEDPRRMTEWRSSQPSATSSRVEARYASDTISAEEGDELGASVPGCRSSTGVASRRNHSTGAKFDESAASRATGRSWRSSATVFTARARSTFVAARRHQRVCDVSATSEGIEPTIRAELLLHTSSYGRSVTSGAADRGPSRNRSQLHASSPCRCRSRRRSERSPRSSARSMT